MTSAGLILPTTLHERAAQSILTFFRPRACADTVLVTRSCAFGTAVPQSDLDLAVLLRSDTSDGDRVDLFAAWQQFREQDDAINELCNFSQFSALHLDFFDDEFEPPVWTDNGGPDEFEVRLGNLIAYSVPLSEIGVTLSALRSRWLPYYDERLREMRLEMVSRACVADLDCVPFYLDRGQYFQAFDRLYKAFQEHLQALFIANRAYPVGYDRWIKEQVSGRLGLPHVYSLLPPILEISCLEDGSIMDNVDRLRDLNSSLSY